MESEEINIPELAANQINNAKLLNKKICAVGTTVMRTIESSVSYNKMINFIYFQKKDFPFPKGNFRDELIVCLQIFTYHNETHDASCGFY